MTITKVRVIRPKDRTSPVLAFANVELNGSVTLRDMRLLRSSEEGGAPRLKMPTKQSKSGMYRDIYNPISAEARQTMTEAVVKCLQKALDEDKNETELTFEVEPGEVEFSGLRIRRFPNNRQLKAFASCLVDGDVAIHRIAVILDMDTKALKLTMPNHDIAQSGAYASYYRLTPEAYQKLYNQVMEEYSKMPEDGDDAA